MVTAASLGSTMVTARAVGREGKVYSSNERNTTNSLVCNNINKVVVEENKAKHSLNKVGLL